MSRSSDWSWYQIDSRQILETTNECLCWEQSNLLSSCYIYSLRIFSYSKIVVLSVILFIFFFFTLIPLILTHSFFNFISSSIFIFTFNYFHIFTFILLYINFYLYILLYLYIHFLYPFTLYFSNDSAIPIVSFECDNYCTRFLLKNRQNLPCTFKNSDYLPLC